MKFAYEVIAAKSKVEASHEDEPSQTPMAPRGADRRNPTTDQKKVRREMAKKAGVSDMEDDDLSYAEMDDALWDERNDRERQMAKDDQEGPQYDSRLHGPKTAAGLSDIRELRDPPSSSKTASSFWDAIDAQLKDLRSARSAADVLRILGPGNVPDDGIEFSGQGFFAGSGGDDTVMDALYAAGWSHVKGDSIYYVMKAPNGDLITYIEGDIFKGDQMGTSSSRRTAMDGLPLESPNIPGETQAGGTPDIDDNAEPAMVSESRWFEPVTASPTSDAIAAARRNIIAGARDASSHMGAALNEGCEDPSLVMRCPKCGEVADSFISRFEQACHFCGYVGGLLRSATRHLAGDDFSAGADAGRAYYTSGRYDRGERFQRPEGASDIWMDGFDYGLDNAKKPGWASGPD